MKDLDMKSTFNETLTKKCLLYSGGMDSYVISKLEDFDFLLYVDIGTKYAKEEVEFLKKQGVEVIVDSRLNLADLEMDSGIVPLRNLFFVMIAVEHGASEIVMGVTSGDRIHDKDLKFASLAEDVINHQLQQTWWHPGTEVNINFKYKKYSKGQLIEKYINAGHDPEDLLNKSFSCYEPLENGDPCLECKSCIRKQASLSKYIDITPRAIEKLKVFYTTSKIDEIKTFRGTKMDRGDEDTEILEAYANGFKKQNG